MDGTDFLLAYSDGNGGPPRSANKAGLHGDFVGKVDKALANIQEGLIYVGQGHTHPRAGLEQVYDCDNCERYDKAKYLNIPTEKIDLVDYENKYFGNFGVSYPSIIATSHGFTVYASARINTSKQREANPNLMHQSFLNRGYVYDYKGNFLLKY